MKHLNQFITEYIVNKKLDKPINSEDQYEYHPKTKDELRKNIIECIKNDKDSKYKKLCLQKNNLNNGV